MILDEIESIEFIGYEDTIDIEVDGNHLFFANNILTHNSQFSKNNMTVKIEELTEFYIAYSFKKVMVADTLIGMANTPEERANGFINYKTLKSRNGMKDQIIPLSIDYPRLIIQDLHKAKRG